MKRRQKRKHLENEESQETTEKGEGISKSQEDAPKPGSTEVTKDWNLGVWEVSSASEYYSCVSSPYKLIHAGVQKIHQDSLRPRSPLFRIQEQGEISYHSQVSVPSLSSYKTCRSSLCGNKKVRCMKIYYMEVQTKKGVAVSWETEKTSESVEKHPRMEEMTLPKDVWVGTPPSEVSTRNLLPDSELSGEEKEHEERAESDSPPASPAVEERPRARTPDWLVTTENGFRCMACCRVFSTLENLQDHVQYGIREGFSCHVFHLTMAQLTGNMELESTQDEEEEDEEEEQEENEDEDQQPTGEGLSMKRPWSQCPGFVFHSPKDRK
ncbi:PREDICTED: protein FAM170A [Chrysochloris asiatica]|uniref:Protein FAM170A n=1 Tax=Chrysochloris asiatica TaxID=185453 RepID=A0A9B0U4B7_CHRAS|nr:PREDICTED: protein FAM170A [Chrysochloris asiatica]